MHGGRCHLNRTTTMAALLRQRSLWPVARMAPTLPLRAVRNAHFDSNAFVQRLENAGITPEQADVLVTALMDVINESIENIAHGLVRRDEAERLNYTQKVCTDAGASDAGGLCQAQVRNSVAGA